MLDSNPLISVIVPVYNASGYLNRSVNSIQKQTIKDIEIILVDDGSSDGSGEICESLAKSDSRIRVFHQENHGLGYSRCKGVSLCRGRYVAFVDADDYIDPSMYATMLFALEQKKADICASFFNYEYPDGRRLYSEGEQDSAMVGVHDSALFAHFYYEHGPWANGVVASAWNKLYSVAVLKGMSFTSRYAEDEELNDWINARHFKVVCVPEILYYWCHNQGSLTTKPFSAERWNFLNVLEKRISAYGSDSYIVNHTRKLYCDIFVEYYFKSKDAEIPVSNGHMKGFKINCFQLLKSPGFAGIKYLIRMGVFLISPKFYQRYVFNVK